MNKNFEKMKDQDIFSSLVEMLNKKPVNEQVRNIVFWFDETGESQELVKEFAPPNAKVIEFDGNNFFNVRYEIEVESPTSNFLVYAPIPKPVTLLNYLIDIYKYSQHFEADISTIRMRELGISERNASDMIDVVKANEKFLKNKDRKQKLVDFQIKNWNKSTFTVGTLCVITKQTLFDFDSALFELVNDFIIKGSLIEEVKNYCDEIAINEMIFNKYGVTGALNNFEAFIFEIFKMGFALAFKGDLPRNWKAGKEYSPQMQSSSYVFLDKYKRKFEDEYLLLENYVAEGLNFSNYLNSWTIEMLNGADTFRQIDEHIVKLLLSDLLYGKNYANVEKTVYNRYETYFSDMFKNEYKALLYGSKFLALASKTNFVFNEIDASAVYKNYVQNYYEFDLFYRKFIYYKTHVKYEWFNDLYEEIEGIYNNKYMDTLSQKWNKVCLGVSWKDISAEKQWDFYRRFIARDENRVVVIISDAMRYEVGFELNEKLNTSKELKVSARISSMLSTVPSYTDIGMASLLPYENITYSDKGNVLVDGIVASGTQSRNTILNKQKPSLALLYEEVSNTKINDLKEKLASQKVVYIYHNTIDAYGDNPATENKVFVGAKTAISELEELVKKLVNCSIYNIFITSDHGFIYKDTALTELDKTPLEDIVALVENKRFIISRQNIESDASIKTNLKYLVKESDLNLYMPYGNNMFKKRGKGKRYVHGGSALQEVVVPLIKVEHRRSQLQDNLAKPVMLSFLGGVNKITSLVTSLDFFQKDKVSAKIIARNYELYFEDENKNVITNKVNIFANSDSDEVSQRIYKKSFIFADKKYDKFKEYYLVIKDMENETETTVAFTIDLLFASDFGF